MLFALMACGFCGDSIENYKHFLQEADLAKKANLIQEFQEKGDLATLRLILAGKNRWAATQAARSICRYLGPKKAAIFAKELKLGTPTWRATMYFLITGKKKDVISYFLWAIDRAPPNERAFLYTLFAERQWPELKHAAKKDVGREEYYLEISAYSRFGPSTIGSVSEYYLEKIGEMSKRSK